MNFKLSTLVYNGREIRTILALQEHGEKLQLALTIREHLYSKYKEKRKGQFLFEIVFS